MKKIEAVIFDIGGVFIGLDFSRAVTRTALALKRPVADVQRRLFGAHNLHAADRMEYMNDYECGRIDEAAFHRCVEGVLGAALPYESFIAAWNDVFLEPIYATLELAAELQRRGGLKLGVLSNNNALHWNVLKPKFPVLEKFDHVFLSHEIGLRKPHAPAFEYTLKKMAVRAERAVFIDDLKENILTAQSLGMKTVHAVDAEAVRAGLLEFGVI